MIINVNFGGLVQDVGKEVGKYISSGEEEVAKSQEEMLAKSQRKLFDNAVFVKAIADAVYCITTDDKPHIFKCSEEVMPNQFTMPIDLVSLAQSPARRHFQLHQKIMQDALDRGFKRALILEPGVKLTRLPRVDKSVSEIPISGIAVLGGVFCIDETFIATSNPLFQHGHAKVASAILVTESFMQKMVNVDATFFQMSPEEFYRQCWDVICMVPPCFQDIQTSANKQILTKITHMYRSCTSLNIHTIVVAVAIVLVVLLILGMLY